MTPTQKHSRKHFASDCYLGYLKWGTTETSEQKPLNNDKNDIMTPMFEKKHASALPHWNTVTTHGYTHPFQERWASKNISNTPTHPWSISRHFGDFAHNYSRARRDFEHYFHRPLITALQAYETARQSGLRLQAVTIGHFHHVTCKKHCPTRPKQREGKSTTGIQR